MVILSATTTKWLNVEGFGGGAPTGVTRVFPSRSPRPGGRQNAKNLTRNSATSIITGQLEKIMARIFTRIGLWPIPSTLEDAP